MLRLLCITAHPDDEAGGFGGALLLYKRRGIETHVICMTPGQAARNRGLAKSDGELSAMRRKEFTAACRILEISHSEVLDYPDGKLEKMNFMEVVGDLTRRVRQIKPQVILTFGTEGAVTAHPDHTMACLYATSAFHWAGRTNRFPEQLEEQGLKPHVTQKLYYATAPFTLPDRQPVSLPPTTATIDIDEFLEAKIAAFRAHTSQLPLADLFESMVRRRGAKEFFHLAAANTPRKLEVESDLFAGIVD